MKYIIMTLLIVLPLQSWATGGKKDEPTTVAISGSKSGADADARSSSYSKSSSDSDSYSKSAVDSDVRVGVGVGVKTEVKGAKVGDISTTVTGGAVGDTSSASSVGDTVNEGNTSSNNIEGDTISINGDTHTFKEAANTAIAGYGNTTASCFRTYGLGFSSRDNSTSLGLPFKDGDCALAEASALAFANGNPTSGWKMYCSQWPVMKVYGAKRRWLVLLYRIDTHKAAFSACLNDAIIVAQNSGDENTQRVLSALANVSANQHGTLEELRKRVEELEKLAHPQGKGFTGDMVRKIVREEAPCSNQEKMCGAE